MNPIGNLLHTLQMVLRNPKCSLPRGPRMDIEKVVQDYSPTGVLSPDPFGDALRLIVDNDRELLHRELREVSYMDAYDDARHAWLGYLEDADLPEPWASLATAALSQVDWEHWMCHYRTKIAEGKL